MCQVPAASPLSFSTNFADASGYLDSFLLNILMVLPQVLPLVFFAGSASGSPFKALAGSSSGSSHFFAGSAYGSPYSLAGSDSGCPSKSLAGSAPGSPASSLAGSASCSPSSYFPCFAPGSPSTSLAGCLLRAVEMLTASGQPALD